MLLIFLQTSDPYGKTIAAATVVMAVATVVAVVANILLWLKTSESVDITRRMFEVAHRPYVGTIDIQRIVDEDQTKFFVHYVNGGTVAAHDVQTSLILIADGLIIPNVEREEKTSVFLLPNRPHTLVSLVHEPAELAAVNAAGSFSIVFRCTYKGIDNKEYSYEEKFAYDRLHEDFRCVKTTAT